MLSSWELSDLASLLRRERLFVNSEQQTLQVLNEKVIEVSKSLAQLAWISSHQRINLNHLILARIDCPQALICQRNYTLENVVFVDACKVIGYQETLAYGEFLTLLHNNVEFVARCLSVGEKLFPELMPEIIYSLSAGLFGSFLLPEDKIIVLKLLQQLIVLQLVPSDNPRRMLRHGTCAFARFYSLFHENLYSAKLFLTAALHGPIMKLLMKDEMFLDIDPDKAVIRYPAEERYKKFGPEGSPEYASKLQKHRQWIVEKLVNLTDNFIISLRENMHCFPVSVCWLVRQMATLLTKSGYLGEKEIYEICIDLLFTYFICPAIVNPEPYGITDVPISYIARFNLMQVAQILQMLAMKKYQDVDVKVADLYGKFHSDCMSGFLDRILDDLNVCYDNQPPVEENNEIQGLSRSAALFTPSQLNNLVRFFQNLHQSENDLLDKNQLDSLISRLPSAWTNGVKSETPKFQNEKSHSVESSILRKPSVLLSKVNRQKSNSPSYSGIGTILGNNDNLDDSKIEEELPQQILVLPLSNREGEPVGLMSEHKVLELEGKKQIDVMPMSTKDQVLSESGEGRYGEGPEKRTRFSLSHDEGSIGNTSDNLEAVSEAASNHSEASSLESENENQNDNLSDMVSANVSGRGTPNISGRDTPSSQVTEGDEARGGEEESRGSTSEHRQVVPSVSNITQTRSEIDDKFGKFEIKKQEMQGDETKSLVSDTWSTDVLASDSEMVEQSERNFPRPPETDGPPHPFIQSLDISETASEAWSTDVLTSDSERLTEVDTDDTASVARSDDTAHSEFGIRGEADGGETPPLQSGAFRPIRESSNGRVSLGIPPSPTRADMWNVTGRGGLKSDYRRRTLEYIDSGLARNFNKTSTPEGGRLIHVIDKIDSVKQLQTQSSTIFRIGRSGSMSRSKSPQSSQSQPLQNGIDNPLSDPHLVPDESGQKLTLDNSCSPVVEPEIGVQRASERGNFVIESGTLYDDSDITPPSPFLSNAFPPPSLLPSDSLFLSNSKPQTSYALPYKFNDMKLKQEGEESERVFLSSTSLASTSSSGSNSGLPAVSQPVTQKIEKVSVSTTGAIPKSISFDKTAERGDKEFMDEDQKQRKGFFRNLKMSFKNRKIKHLKGEDLGRFEENGCGTNGEPFDNLASRRELTGDNEVQNGNAIEDILAKYRSKPPAETEELVPTNLIEKKLIEEEDEGLSDESIFINAKRKLRLVLCNSDLHIYGSGLVISEDQLVSFLKLQLAEAINLQNRSLVSQLQETLRCIRLFDNEDCRRLLKSLKEDYQNRAPYMAYLVRSRQLLLSSIAHFERMTERVESDGRACRKFLVALCVRIFLERREDICRGFSKEFQLLTLPDEKTDLLDKFLTDLSHQLTRDHNWIGASEAQLEQAKSIIETAIISRVYPYALYPNGDVDRCRDHVLHEHMKKLASIITPNHKDLQIPKMFHVECPWPSAQAEISALAAYKTPKDKVSCICRCAATIMNLLSMAFDGKVPAADDFVPVLVFVLIAANPPALLSTVQYVESFYGSRLEGEEQYWWTQFSSAIEFIKTMD